MSNKTADHLKGQKFKGRVPMNDFVQLMTSLSGRQGVLDALVDDGHVTVYLHENVGWHDIEAFVVKSIAEYLKVPAEAIDVTYIAQVS